MWDMFIKPVKAILVEKDSYLLKLSRYVVMNPVRAGLVKNAAQWPRSSYSAMTGKRSRLAWLKKDWILARFGRQRHGRLLPIGILFMQEWDCRVFGKT